MVGYTEDQLALMEFAAKTNSQVENVSIPDGPGNWISGPDLMARFVEQHRAPSSTASDPWSVAGFCA
jgi:hypothetical protein